jgi:acylphosphatase
MNVSYISHVSGKVQGVYFRVSSQQKAIEYGLSGYARNLADGEVEVFLSGKYVDVQKMLVWLETGPTLAEVTKVQHKQVDFQEYDFFSIS